MNEVTDFESFLGSVREKYTNFSPTVYQLGMFDSFGWGSSFLYTTRRRGTTTAIAIRILYDLMRGNKIAYLSNERTDRQDVLKKIEYYATNSGITELSTAHHDGYVRSSTGGWAWFHSLAHPMAEIRGMSPDIVYMVLDRSAAPNTDLGSVHTSNTTHHTIIVR